MTHYSRKFGTRARLLCGMCLTISSHHGVIPGSEEVVGGFLRVAYRCSCGNEDQDYFTDSGNFESEDTKAMSWDNKAKLESLKEEVTRLSEAVEQAESRWDELWDTDEDVVI